MPSFHQPITNDWMLWTHDRADELRRIAEQQRLSKLAKRQSRSNHR
jgi:hypothetical protein